MERMQILRKNVNFAEVDFFSTIQPEWRNRNRDLFCNLFRVVGRSTALLMSAGICAVNHKTSENWIHSKSVQKKLNNKIRSSKSKIILNNVLLILQIDTNNHFPGICTTKFMMLALIVFCQTAYSSTSWSQRHMCHVQLSTLESLAQQAKCVEIASCPGDSLRFLLFIKSLWKSQV